MLDGVEVAENGMAVSGKVTIPTPEAIKEVGEVDAWTAAATMDALEALDVLSEYVDSHDHLRKLRDHTYKIFMDAGGVPAVIGRAAYAEELRIGDGNDVS